MTSPKRATPTIAERLAEFVGSAITALKGFDGSTYEVEIVTPVGVLKIGATSHEDLHVQLGKKVSQKLSMMDALALLPGRKVRTSEAPGGPNNLVITFEDEEVLHISSDPDVEFDQKLTYTYTRIVWEDVI